MPESPPNDKKLDSWKEIAAHIGRDTRTAMRWEKEKGLPVHRPPGGPRQRVFAYKHELDAWLHGDKTTESSSPHHEHIDPKSVDSIRVEEFGSSQQSNSSVPQDSASIDCPAPRGTESGGAERRSLLELHLSTNRKLKWAAIACALGVSMAVSIGLMLHKSAVPRIIHLEKLTIDGQAKSNLRSYGTRIYFNQFDVGREILAMFSVDDRTIHTIATPFTNVDLQDISNDGLTLLVTSFEGAVEKGGRPLWTLPIMGGSPRRLGEAFCDVARWSPDNRNIVCVNGASILLFDTDGSDIHSLGSFPSIPRSLLWSPNGEKLRFVVVDVNTRIQTAWELAFNKNKSAPSTSATVLPLGIDCCWSWMWTHDSKNFLYTKHDVDDRPALFLRSEHGSSAHEAEFPVQISDIGELAPGKADNQLYVLMGDTYRGQLFKFDSKSKAFQTLLPGLSADCLSFSPDGVWMTYVSLPDQSLWRSRLNGSEAIQLTSPPMEAEYSAWSPDGRQIAFMGKKPGKPWRIFLIDRDGGAMKEAARGDDNQGAPTWSVDGTRLVYGNISCEATHSCWIRRIQLATGEEELLPESNGFRTARWSPNGKYIAALRPQIHELMLFDVQMRRWTTLADSITGDNLNWSSDSQYIYADTLRGTKTVIERVRARDGQREVFVDLALLQRSPGQLDYWIGLARDNSPLVLHQFTEVEVYAVEWTN